MTETDYSAKIAQMVPGTVWAFREGPEIQLELVQGDVVFLKEFPYSITQGTMKEFFLYPTTLTDFLANYDIVEYDESQSSSDSEVEADGN